MRDWDDYIRRFYALSAEQQQSEWARLTSDQKRQFVAVRAASTEAPPRRPGPPSRPSISKAAALGCAVVLMITVILVGSRMSPTDENRPEAEQQHATASSQQRQRTQPQEAFQSELEDVARRKKIAELLAEIEQLSEYHVIKRRDLYRQLTQLAPEEPLYAERMRFYSVKADEQVLRLRRTQRREPSDRAQEKDGPTRASESLYNFDIRKAKTSRNLSNADLAWHAVNTYGWNCDEVIDRSEGQGDYYVISCSSGLQLRVYPRSNQHPRITNIRGSYR